jgi:hypothetical protein
VFEQARKKFLNQILGFFSSGAMSPDKSIKRSPIRSTEYFERSLCSGRFALRLQYYAPMSGGERCTGVLSDSGRINRGQLANAFGLLSSAHASIQVKTCSKIKPADSSQSGGSEAEQESADFILEEISDR